MLESNPSVQFISVEKTLEPNPGVRSISGEKNFVTEPERSVYFGCQKKLD